MIVYWHCERCETGGRVVAETDDDVAILIVAKHRRSSPHCIVGPNDIEVEVEPTNESADGLV